MFTSWVRLPSDCLDACCKFVSPSHLQDSTPPPVGIDGAALTLVNPHPTCYSRSYHPPPPQVWQQSGSNGMTELKIKGMTCNHCKSAVENALKSVDNINNVEDDLANVLIRVYGIVIASYL